MAEKKILIIDDEIDIARIYEQQVKQLGYDCVVVSPGEDPVEKIDQVWNEIDLVITDINMPIVDYQEIIQKAKDTQKLYIVVTGQQDISAPFHYNKLDLVGKFKNVVEAVINGDVSVKK